MRFERGRKAALSDSAAGDMKPSFRTTLLSRHQVLIPRSGRLPGGLWMNSACRPLAVLANNSSGYLARSSVRLIPGATAELVTALDENEWRAIRSAVRSWKKKDALVVMKPSEPRRARLIIMPLDSSRRPRAFLKATIDPPNPLATSMLAALAAEEAPFIFPRIRDVVRVGQWWVTVEEPLPQRPHRPARLDREARHRLAKEIQALISHDRSNSVPTHGDLGPWNVRNFAGLGLAVLDWEYAQWAPVATDELWHAITFRLATRRRRGAAAGEGVRGELSHYYSEDQLRDAAFFLKTRWDDAEPNDIQAGVDKSRRLEGFENRLLEALAEFT